MAGCVATDNMGLASINVLSGMRWLCAMGGPQACIISMCLWGALYCGAHFQLYGGFPSLQHNNIRDITACFFSKVCHNVALESSLIPLSGERFRHKIANTENGAHLGIRARGFWDERHQSAFFEENQLYPRSSVQEKAVIRVGLEWKWERWRLAVT